MFAHTCQHSYQCKCVLIKLTHMDACIHTKRYTVLHCSYIYIYVHIYLHTYTRILTYIYTYVHIYICTYIHIYIHTYTCPAVGNILPLHHLKHFCIVETDKYLRLYKSNIHIFTHTYRTHIYTRTCIYIYMYPYIYIYIHIYMHTHSCMNIYIFALHTSLSAKSCRWTIESFSTRHRDLCVMQYHLQSTYV